MARDTVTPPVGSRASTVVGLTAVLAIIVLGLSLSCTSQVDRAGAKALSDSFMADLVENRLDDALSKMDPAFIQKAGGREKAIGLMQTIFNYCGHPLSSTYWRDEVGVHSLDGRTKPMRSFLYATPTTQRPEGGCYYRVNVVPGDQGGYSVVASTVGKLPR
jgi:hypothetical protein